MLFRSVLTLLWNRYILIIKELDMRKVLFDIFFIVVVVVLVLLNIMGVMNGRF